MDSYIPFLKYKSNEIIGLGELDLDVLERVIPFFDYPRPNEPKTCEEFVSDVQRLARSVKKHLSKFREIYIDTYDFDGNYEIEGVYSYFYLVDSIRGMDVIPVVSIDRGIEHLESVIDLARENRISSDVVAFRITAEDFSNYLVVEDEIRDLLGEVFEEYSEVDLIFDCRLCTSVNPQEIGQQIADFFSLFSDNYVVRRKIVTGSSIPASVGDILVVNSECHIVKKEIDIFKNVIRYSGNVNFIYGDYAIVSPNYSDVIIQPEIMQNVMTAKLIYTYDNKHYFIRGGSLKTKGYEQYFDLAGVVCAKPFFRGADYSAGDAYLEEKSRREGSNCMPGTIIKPSINAHITYIVRDCPI